MDIAAYYYFEKLTFKAVSLLQHPLQHATPSLKRLCQGFGGAGDTGEDGCSDGC
jgi:hypothetical protein